jgi:DNA-binding NtrC family response regulator
MIGEGNRTMSSSVLLVDDDPSALEYVGTYLERAGYEVYRAGDARAGLESHQIHCQDVVVLDLELPDLTGIQVLERLNTRDVGVILLTGHGGIDTAVRAMQLGADDFLTKPVDFNHLDAVIARAAEKVRLRLELDRLKNSHAPEATTGDLGPSAKMRALARQVELFADSERTTVLLTGESGTGKGWVARLIHSLSRRADRPFVDINCGGLSQSFLDSELFGHEKGAFTDAKEMKRGLFEIADTGTLFLDEIGELALSLQPKLLRVLDSKTFRRLGGTKDLKVDVRLIAATNRDLSASINERTFREDLFYRISVGTLNLPPLRERSEEDRLHLLNRLLAGICKEVGRANIPELSKEALEQLLNYKWPGNIREMRNVIERALIMAQWEQVDLCHLPADIRKRKNWNNAQTRVRSLQDMEREQIEHALRYHRGNRTQAARDLGISRVTLLKKVKKYDLK